MGQNLILNMNDHNFKVLAYNRSKNKIDDFINGPAANTNIKGAYSLEQLVEGLERPRKVMLMVRAGEVVDHFIDHLLPLLDEGDIIIDGGNSNFPDTSRRVSALKEKGILFIGTGVSGGEEGARKGPSIMPGGDSAAWPFVKPIFQAISAKTKEGDACCDWVGEGGAGHFVKMVHNGIEYGDMQLISEAYHFMKEGLGMTYPEMQSTFSAWNKTELESYLIEITADILGTSDTLAMDNSCVKDSCVKGNDKSEGADKAQPLLENILDAAGQKGTGKWTGINSLDLGVPLTLITESVFARCLSALKQERVHAASLFNKTIKPIEGERGYWLDALRQALLASKIISYAQGFMLMRQASDEHNWVLNYGNVALMWRGGCIIRSAFLSNIRDAYASNQDLAFLGSDAYFKKILEDCSGSWRKVTAKAIEQGIPMPCMTSAISFFDAYTTARLPANLLQAQRDYFGAHTYERTDKPRGEYFHTDWTGSGGDMSSSNYDL